MNAHDDYLAEALARLQDAIRERVGSTVLLSKADACAIGAALAAPKEAGDGDYLRVMRNLEREYPMDAKVIAAYIARLHDGIRRLAAPSKEAGALDELTREQERLGLYAVPQADAASDRHCDVCGFTKSGLSECPNASAHVASDAAPQADQQGEKWSAEVVSLLSEKYGFAPEAATVFASAELAEYRAGECDCAELAPEDIVDLLMDVAREAVGKWKRESVGRPYGYKPSDQQGASLEGDAVVWVQLEDGKPVAMSFTRNEAAGCTTPFTASKASPDDQRQEGADMVPLSVALNAVDHVGSANYESRCREARRWLHEAASAAREWS